MTELLVDANLCFSSHLQNMWPLVFQTLLGPFSLFPPCGTSVTLAGHFLLPRSSLSLGAYFFFSSSLSFFSQFGWLYWSILNFSDSFSYVQFNVVPLQYVFHFMNCTFQFYLFHLVLFSVSISSLRFSMCSFMWPYFNLNLWVYYGWFKVLLIWKFNIWVEKNYFLPGRTS